MSRSDVRGAFLGTERDGFVSKLMELEDSLSGKLRRVKHVSEVFDHHPES